MTKNRALKVPQLAQFVVVDISVVVISVDVSLGDISVVVVISVGGASEASVP